jgi:DNA-binding HxlR family transcriptional regulator
MAVSETILALTAHRWNVPVLAHLGPIGAASFTDLREGLSVCRDSLVRTLGALERPGWVAPRRSEYALTRLGERVAPPSADLLRTARSRRLEDLVLRKWSLPVAAALEGWELGFAEVRAMLPGITPRALTLALKSLVEARLVDRRIVGGFPPASAYRLTERGRAFLPALLELGTVPPP